MAANFQTTDHDHIPQTFTVESLKEALWEEEIDLLNEGDDPIIEEAAPADKADAAPDDPDAAEAIGNAEAQAAKAKEEDATAAAEQVAAQQATEEAAKADDPAPATPDPAVEDPFAAIQKPVLPEPVDVSEHEAVLNSVKDDLKAVLDKLDDGELTSDEFAAEQQAIIERQAEARAAIAVAENTASNAVEAIKQYWLSNLDVYKSQGTEDLWSEEHLSGWDRNLRAVTADDEHRKLSMPEQIKLAHSLYAAEYEAKNGKALGIPVPTKKAAPKADTNTDDDGKMKVREDKRPDAPTTLGGLNTDAASDVQDSQFAAIDRMMDKDPVKAEEMLADLAKRNPQMLDSYLEGA